MNPAMQKLGEALTQEPPRKAIRLYEITDALDNIEAALLESNGVLSDEMEAELEAMELAFDEKVERICRVITNNERTAAAYADEIDRLALHRDAHERTAKRLKEYLKGAMLVLGRDKVSAGVFKVAIQNNSRPSISWTLAPEDIPEPFKRIRVELNGTAAYDAYRDKGTLPEGFEIVNGQHVRIR